MILFFCYFLFYFETVTSCVVSLSDRCVSFLFLQCHSSVSLVHLMINFVPCTFVDLYFFFYSSSFVATLCFFQSCSVFPGFLFFLLCHSLFVWWNSPLVPEASRVFLCLGRSVVTTVILTEVFLFAGEGRPLVLHLVRLFWIPLKYELKKKERESKEKRLLALFASANHRYVKFLWYECSTSCLLRLDVLGKLHVIAEHIWTCWLWIVSTSHQKHLDLSPRAQLEISWLLLENLIILCWFLLEKLSRALLHVQWCRVYTSGNFPGHKYPVASHLGRNTPAQTLDVWNVWRDSDEFGTPSDTLIGCLFSDHFDWRCASESARCVREVEVMMMNKPLFSSCDVFV